MFNTEKDEVVQLYLDDIIPNRFQPREIFDERALKELAVSIREHGVIQPIIVRSVANGKYEIIAGERRYKASALAGLTKIPAIIRNLDDKESSKVALLENLQRKNLNPIEEARTYQKILEIDQMTQEELAKTMGKSQSAVANKLRLLSLPDAIQNALLKEQISERHARALINVPDTKKQKDLLKKIIDNKMSVRAVEEEIKKLYPKDTKNGNDVPLMPQDQVASASSFVNSNPLIPTAELPQDESNFGKVTIAPPEGEEMPTGKFINYGEIGKEKDEESTIQNIPNSITSIDVNTLRNNANDINSGNNGSSLDNLLNIGGQSSFITPAEQIVKTDTFDKENKSKDYFSTADLSALNIPQETSNIVPINNGMIPISNVAEENYTIEQATEKIRELVNDLKEHGVNINTDEMNFEKSYQIIIKLYDSICNVYPNAMQQYTSIFYPYKCDIYIPNVSNELLEKLNISPQK